MPKKRIFNKVKVIVVRDYHELSQLAAKIVLKKISAVNNVAIIEQSL